MGEPGLGQTSGSGRAPPEAAAGSRWLVRRRSGSRRNTAAASLSVTGATGPNEASGASQVALCVGSPLQRRLASRVELSAQSWKAYVGEEVPVAR